MNNSDIKNIEINNQRMIELLSLKKDEPLNVSKKPVVGPIVVGPIYNSDIAIEAHIFGLPIKYAEKAGYNASYFKIMLYLELDIDVLKKCLDKIERFKKIVRLYMFMKDEDSGTIKLRSRLPKLQPQWVENLMNYDDEDKTLDILINLNLENKYLAFLLDNPVFFKEQFVDFIYKGRGQFNDKNVPEFFKNSSNNKSIRICKHDMENIRKITDTDNFRQLQIDIFNMQCIIEKQRMLIKKAEAKIDKWQKKMKGTITDRRVFYDDESVTTTEILTPPTARERDNYSNKLTKLAKEKKMARDIIAKNERQINERQAYCNKTIKDIKKYKLNSPLGRLALDTDSEPTVSAGMKDEIDNIDKKINHIKEIVGENWSGIKDEADKNKTAKNITIEAQVWMCLVLVLACNNFLEDHSVIPQKYLNIALKNLKIACNFIEKNGNSQQLNTFNNNEDLCRAKGSKIVVGKTVQDDGNEQKAENLVMLKKPSLLGRLSVFTTDNNPKQNNGVEHSPSTHVNVSPHFQ